MSNLHCYLYELSCKPSIADLIQSQLVFIYPIVIDYFQDSVRIQIPIEGNKDCIEEIESRIKEYKSLQIITNAVRYRIVETVNLFEE